MGSEDLGALRAIVLIDDDADLLHVMKRRLQATKSEYATTEPVEISTFTDPVEALVNMPVKGICVTFVDYNMPGGTGLEWLPKLIATGLGPVIFLSSQTDVKVTADAFRAGASDFIPKADAMADEKRLARAIREAVQRFRLEVSNRTLTRQLKLVNLELEAKNKRLHELTETAKQFVDDVAHDFRTPLTVIQQYASIVSEGLSGPVTEKQTNHLAIITEATQDLSEMVDDFLDSSKLRARSLCVDRQRHAVQELFESIEPMLAVRAAPKQIPVERNIADNIPPFFADLSKATRVLTNLVVNAIKVTPQGSPLKIWARPTEAGDVRIGVTDAGPGLRESDLKVIFERFKQVHQPQVAGTKGFGLGLSIVKNLTWLNLGAVDTQSELGKGSTFSFTMPAEDLSRILTCYLENSRAVEEAGELRILRISSRGPATDASALRQMIASFCYPMDLVLEDSQAKGVNALGITRDAEAWATRLRGEVARFQKSMEEPTPIELEIEFSGPWSRETNAAELHATLLESLNRKTVNA
jgi:signal transduction histidine kinase